jgi:hypothetical protein
VARRVVYDGLGERVEIAERLRERSGIVGVSTIELAPLSLNRRQTIGRGFREPRADVVWLAGLAWLVVAILRVPFSAIFVLTVILAPLAIPVGIAFVSIPLALSPVYGDGVASRQP